jgi:PAS domain S-box-containing protein
VSAGNSASDDPLIDQIDESIEELYEQAPCGYLTTTLNGKIIKANQTFLHWLGYKPDDVIGKKRFVELLTAGGRIFFETHFNLLLRVQDSVDEIALDVICKDGRVMPTLINARQKRNGLGEPVLNRFTIFNATERRTYERDLLLARDLFRTTLASIGDGVVATDAEGRITLMNGEAERLSGWEEDQAIGKPIEQVLPFRSEDHLGLIENPVRHALRDGQPVTLADHTVLAGKDGQVMNVDDCASPIRDENGNVIGGVMVFRDVTETRRAHRALAEAQALAESMIVELRRSNDDLSQFAAVASHDLRSPLNNIMQLSQLLERRHSDELEGGKELLGLLVTSAKRMGALIEDLLRYARITSDVTVPDEPVDANEQIEIATQNLQTSIARSGAIVTHDQLPSLRMNATHLGQIFQNLIGNAIHYRSAETPRIHVAVADQDQLWLFSCADNGVGVAPAYQHEIFAPFKRLHGHDRPGSGIGLAICKKIVERFGGTIWVESSEGKGSTFLFTLPKAA